MPHEGCSSHKNDKDDEFQAMEKTEAGCGGHSHSHGDHKEGEMDEDMKNYEASKKKLYLVSFVTVFFIIA